MGSLAGLWGRGLVMSRQRRDHLTWRPRAAGWAWRRSGSMNDPGSGPLHLVVGPRSPFVAAQEEGMPGGVGEDLPAVAVGAGEVLLQCRAELDDAALLGLDFAYFEVEVVLLGVLAVGPARRAVVLHPLEGQVDAAKADGGRGVAAALYDGAAGHLGVEGRQLHRVRA